MLCSFVNRAAHPATPLESNSCTSHTSNSPGITSLHKNRGGGVLPPTNPVAPASPPLNLPLLDVLCLGDWIHLPSDKMQESRPTQRSTIQSTRPNHCHHERSEVLCAIACLLRDVLFGIARLLRDESAFLFRSVTSAPAASQSPVDTTRVLPYSAPANEPANPSPPSSSRHSAALDEVCIAIR